MSKMGLRDDSASKNGDGDVIRKIIFGDVSVCFIFGKAAPATLGLRIKLNRKLGKSGKSFLKVSWRPTLYCLHIFG